jgi:hypothetical protein
MSAAKSNAGADTPEGLLSALFANMVIQQANMALMFLGKMAHPETGRSVFDLESAQLMIDQLNMLQVKTKGNLDKQEEALLQESLMSLRLAFVEVASSQERPPAAAHPPAAAPGTTPAASPSEGAPPGPGGEEPHRKFSKKY